VELDVINLERSLELDIISMESFTTTILVVAPRRTSNNISEDISVVLLGLSIRDRLKGDDTEEEAGNGAEGLEKNVQRSG
jgi:hypothetical protein